MKSSDAGDFTSVIRVRVDAGKKPHRLAAKAKDMAELTKLFAANNVTITLNYNSTAITGTISGTKETVGRP